MSVIRIAGIDPSLRNTGYSLGKLDTNTRFYSVTRVGLIQTDKTKNKQIRANSDTLERTDKLLKGLSKAVEGVDLVFAELPSGSQTASGMKSYALSIALIAAVTQDKALIQVQPNDIKTTIGGRIQTTKQEIIDWAYQAFPEANWPVSKKGILVKTKAEHIADSIAAIEAGLKTREYLNISKFF